LKRQDGSAELAERAKFAKESQNGVLKSVSMPRYCDFSSVSLGALGVLAVKIDLYPEFFHGASLMESP
jgi:hypothetical protein